MERLVWIVYLADVLARSADNSPPNVAEHVKRLADPLIADQIPLSDQDFWAKLIPEVLKDKEIASQLFCDMNSG